MENRYSNVPSANDHAGKLNEKKTGLTPRELIHYHMNNPDEPIRDEDMENLVLHQVATPSSPDAAVNTREDAADNRMLSDKEIKQLEDNSVTTPYDILGG